MPQLGVLKRALAGAALGVRLVSWETVDAYGLACGGSNLGEGGQPAGGLAALCGVVIGARSRRRGDPPLTLVHPAGHCSPALSTAVRNSLAIRALVNVSDCPPSPA
jgi:hypothetical protein